MGFFTKSFFILLVAVSIPLAYRHYADEDTVKFMAQYYSNYKVIDQFIRQSASHLDQAKQYLPNVKQMKMAYEELNKQFNAYLSSLATKQKSNDTTDRQPNTENTLSVNYRLTSCPGEPKSDRLWTKEELSKFDGNSGESDILLGFLGFVYNVTANTQHYGPGAEYNVFAGKDASRAFVTGNFTHDLTDDIRDIEESMYQHIEGWASFYSSSYPQVGRVEGAFFDSNGCATPELTRVYIAIDQVNDQKNYQAELEREMPDCNSEWNGETRQGRVWCSKKSGGIERDWEGSPRIYNDGQSQRCVCVRDSGNQDGNLGVYPGCEPTATECVLAQPQGA